MRTSTKLLIGLGVVTAATPLGMLAKGTAWGEWASRELAVRLGFVPVGLARLENLWHAKLGGYAWPGARGTSQEAVGYLLSAVIGVLLILAVGLGVGKWLTRDGRDHDS
jgi:cobalt/nickel transport system permease protein